jgi:alkanesulfonate monooxygenase SsuD/methylene tetrahydromethanopterin reductase-like flavin-dependent oxidoreductase (luciferase family)
MNSLWSEESTTFDGTFFHLDGVSLQPKPVQQPRPPLWIGARVEAALRRAVRLGDGWMGQGSSSTALFLENVGHVRRFLDEAGRDPATFAISKRVYVAIDDDAGRAIERMTHWIDHHYGRPEMAREVAVWGPAESVYEQLDEIAAGGADHLMMNPVFDHDEHLDALAEYVGSRG